MTSRNSKLIYDDPHECTDLGNSKRLLERHGADLRFVPVWGWLAWDGRRFARDDLGRALELAKDTAVHLLKSAPDAISQPRANELAKWAVRSQDEPRLRRMLKLLETEPDVATLPEEFDSDPMILNVENGVVDLATGHLFDHNRSHMATKLAPVSFDADAAAPRWEEFLERVLPDPAVRGFVQRAVGYSLTGSVAEQCLFLLHGRGANGKSTFLSAIESTLGLDYARTADFSSFLAKGNDGPRNDLARLVGVRFVKSLEMDEGRRLAEALVKALTGGDRIAVRFLHREFFEYVPAFKLWLGCNHRPLIRETGEAIWRRIRLVPFDVTIPKSERDGDLPGKLEEERAGILAWAVRGCLELQRTGLAAPAAVHAATEEYRTESDDLGAFLEDRCELNPHAVEGATDLFNAYRTWAERGGEDAVSQRRFGTMLTDRGIGTDRNGPGRAKRRVGIRLRNDGTDLEPSQGFLPHAHAHKRETGERVQTGPMVPNGRDYEQEYLELQARQRKAAELVKGTA